MGRAPCCEKVGLNRGPWTREEDLKLTEYITKHGEGCWRTLPKSAGLLRCGKSCRLRWINYLRPDLKRGNISEDEDQLIITLHKLLGNRWSLIAGRLPGRTDNEIKNYWNTHLKKKLRGMGIDPHTHKPLAQQQELQRYDHGYENASKDSYHENAQIVISNPPRLVHSSSTNDLLRPLKSLVTSFNKAVEPSVGLRSTQPSDMMALTYHKSVDMLSIDNFLEESVIDQGVHSEVLPELQDYCQSVGPVCVNGSDGKLVLKKSLSSNTENSLSMLSPCSPVSILPQCTFGCTTDIETGSLCTHLLSGHDLSSYSDLDIANGLQSKQLALGTFGESPSITSESTASCGFLQIDVGGTGLTPSSYDSAADMEWERSCRPQDTEVLPPPTTTMVAKKQNHSSIEQLSSFLLDDSIATEEAPERKFQEDSPERSSSTTTDNTLLNMMSSHDSDVSFWDMEIVQPLSDSCSLDTQDLVGDPTTLISMESLTTAMSMSSCNTSSNCNNQWDGTSTGFAHSTEVSALPTLIF